MRRAATGARAGACLAAWLVAGCRGASAAPPASDVDAGRSGDAAYPHVADLGDGTYRNPILLSDWSDPDVLRHGDDFWLVASSFGASPGLPILHSHDLVGWTIAGHALVDVPGARFATPQPGQGVWAPSIREHAGTFHVFFPVYCRPADGGACDEEGIWAVSASTPAGPWSAPRQVVAGRGLIDPCPFWDDDGNAYLVHAYAASRAGFSSRIDVRPMSVDATTTLGEPRTVFADAAREPVIEGPKLYKRDGFYYILAPAGGVPTGWQTALRSRDIYGPYEDRVVLEQGSTDVNGPHQGALVDVPTGDEWWFVHFQDLGAFGRVVHLEPVSWEDGWPLMGRAGDGGVREPVGVHAKPSLPPVSVTRPAADDDFEGEALGAQWEWRANHRDAWWSLSARRGFLRLFPARAPGGSLALAPSVLSQRLPARAFVAETSVEPSGTEGASAAGLVVAAKRDAALAVKEIEGGLEVSLVIDGATVESATLPAGAARLRVAFAADASCRFSYASPGDAEPRAFATTFVAEKGAWVGARVGVFAVAADRDDAPGQADFASFTFSPLDDPPSDAATP